MNSRFRLTAILSLAAACAAVDYGMNDFNVKRLRKTQDECAISYNVSEELAKKINTADFPSFKEVGCYPSCFLQKFGIFDKVFLEDRIQGNIPEEKYDKFLPVLKECANQGGDSPCEIAYNGYKCYIKYVFQY